MKSPSPNTSLLAALAACILMTSACQSATVRGTDGQSLTATTVRSMTIRRGETAALEVAIDRQNFTGAVKVSISQLPKGVETDQSSMKVETTRATFVLAASASADLVSNQAVSITVEDPSGRQALQYVNLTVTG